MPEHAVREPKLRSTMGPEDPDTIDMTAHCFGRCSNVGIRLDRLLSRRPGIGLVNAELSGRAVPAPGRRA